MKFRLIFLIGLTASVSATAQAAITNGYGMYAETAVFGSMSQRSSDGGEFHMTAHSSADNGTALAEASAVYTGSTLAFLPKLTVNTSAAISNQAFAEAFGVQGYTYNGADTTVTLSYNLHGSVSHKDTYSYGHTLWAEIAVFTGDALEWYPHDFVTLLYEYVALTPNIETTEADYLSIRSGLDQNRPGSITFDLTDGMDFYVAAFLGANASNGGFVDASNTFSMSFDNNTGLTAVAISAIPVPAAVWLFGSGLLGLIGIARRQQHI